MKFVYQYRTPDNTQHQGVIAAASKDAAYVALKRQGIKPSRVEDAPGLLNRLLGRGKRWLAIVILAVIAVLAVALLSRQRKETEAAAEAAQYEERAQLYGDPVVIAECESAGWTNVFGRAFDRNLARYAEPGRAVVLEELSPWGEFDPSLIPIDKTDLQEIAKMKRMVNGMKRELSEYLAAGGTVTGYVRRLDIRQKAEAAIYERAKANLRRNVSADEIRSRNAELRAMGLPMVGVDLDPQ